MALWLCRIGRYGQHEQKFLEDSRIYLTWTGFDVDLTGKSRKEIQAAYDEQYPDFSKGRRGVHIGQICAFAAKMKPGDWVAVPTKRKTIHIGEIKTEYHYNASGEDPYFHYRGVEWLETDIPRTNFDQDILDSLGAIMTICRIKRNDAEQRVRAMKGNDWQTTRPQIKIPDKIANLDEVDPDDTDFLRDLEEMAQDHIARMIQAKFKSHKMETLIEAILQAQGYTTRKSDPGADGGVDILAAPGRLGFDRPRICVQVKSQQTPLKREVLDQLLGTMSNVAADQGLLVCWGGFKKTILDEIPRLFFKVRMWDQSDVVQQFLAHYDKLDEDIQAEIPLKRIWVVAAQETEGD